VSKRLIFHWASESFIGFDWDAVNREAHFIKHGIDFPVVEYADWSRIKKAQDRRQRYVPPRNVAIAHCSRIDRALVIVYSKQHHIARIISVRLANDDETALLNA
jgi:uncharacterized DUF497 family protein